MYISELKKHREVCIFFCDKSEYIQVSAELGLSQSECLEYSQITSIKSECVEVSLRNIEKCASFL